MPLRTLSPGRIARLVPAAIAALLVAGSLGSAHAGEILHVVAKGQTLGRIAKRYHTTVDAIREVNNLRRGQQIHPGLTLVIPEKGKEAEAAKRAEKLRAGDDRPDAPTKGGKKGSPIDKGDKGSKAGKAGKKGDDDPSTYARAPKRPGLVHFQRGDEKLEAQLLTRHGRLAPAALAGLSRILRFYPTNAKTTIDPRLASLIGMVSDHFGGRTIHVVSGFRPYTPAQYTPHSNHNVGRAMDFTVEGIPNTVLRDFCRTFRNAGVGYYPNSTFVHLDARSGKAFWVDYSRAGEAPHYDSPNSSANADEAAKDVEGHPGLGDTGAADPDAEASPPGSNTTQNGRPEPLDKKSGNADTRDPNPATSGRTGQK